MIRSMTGFGRGHAQTNRVEVTVEIKTLNSRYLDLTVRMPNAFSDKENLFKAIIQPYLDRGKVTLSVNVDRSRSENGSLSVRPEKIKAYGKLLEEARQLSGISQPVTIRDLLQFGDLFQRENEDPEILEETWALIEQASIEALVALRTMREKEGAELGSELRSQIDEIETHLGRITDLTSDRAPELLEQYRERISRLVEDDKIDADRLEMEVAILIDKMDIQEEIIRLQSHVKYFREALEQDQAIGRRLNFLSQEINRELNTIGSKANHPEISHRVVQAKENLEQIREQVQNVE
ncbi:MAG: YicC/YloC family endoribonuclease [Balneolaceae bacterium]